ncbi:MAG: ATP-binding protein [Neomegalonema sp.]|nr:ATP-binding protein [Neomegalonema sp.]
MSSLQDFVEATKISPRFFFRGGEADRAVREIASALAADSEVVVFTGEPGIGKTFALTQLSALVSDRAAVAGVFFTDLDFPSFLQVVCTKFGGRGGDRPGAALRRRLRALRAKGETAILIIDDAHRLDEEGLDKLLIETRDPITNEMLLRLVLAGPTELEHRLQKPQNAALAAKVGAFVRLHPMPAEEARAFVSEWLAAAGQLPLEVIEPAAQDRLVLRGKGNPRMLNALCLHVLHAAARLGLPRIGFDTVETAAVDARVLGADGPALPAPNFALTSDQRPPRPPSPLDQRPRPKPKARDEIEDYVEPSRGGWLWPALFAVLAIGAAGAGIALYMQQNGLL